MILLVINLFSRIGLVTLLGACLVGCSGALSKKRADREVFGLLRSKTSKIPNSGTDLLDVTPPSPLDLTALEKNLKTEEFLGDRAPVEKEARKVNLADCLQFAVSRNRGYLGEKELVYLTALDLTLTRQQFTPILTGGGAAELRNSAVETSVNEFIKESTLTSTGNLGLGMLQRTGTRLAADLSVDFSKFLSGDLRSITDSNLAVTLTQPLLRGAGYLAASEVLTQGERDVLYSIRDFTQFRKEFAVDVAGRYYNVLQAREAAKNAYLAYQALNQSVEGEVVQFEDGKRATKSALLQIRQAQQSSESRWRSAVRSYEEELDSLKVELGFPVEEPLLLDGQDLDGLEIIDPPGTLEEAMTTALVTRLDVWNQRDQVEDAVRRVKIAEQDLLPTANLVGGYVPRAAASNQQNLKVDGRRRDVSMRLDVDLNLNQKPVRNALRAAQIAEQRARRELDLVEERVRGGIRTAWRELDLARKQYNIALEGMQIAEERVALESDLFQEGRGTARDKVEALRDLNDARNAVIASRITHTLARLRLWRDMGVLFIKKEGDWVNVLSKETPKGS